MTREHAWLGVLVACISWLWVNPHHVDIRGAKDRGIGRCLRGAEKAEPGRAGPWSLSSATTPNGHPHLGKRIDGPVNVSDQETNGGAVGRSAR